VGQWAGGLAAWQAGRVVEVWLGGNLVGQQHFLIENKKSDPRRKKQNPE
jgi:hypothetical protein